MRTIKIKLISLVAMICLVIGIMIVGIFSAQTQQIKLNGQVNFEIADKCLYVKDVRMQEDNNLSPYSLSEQGKFMLGYVNGEFNMNLGNFTNTYGSFALYFDIINTMDETSGETYAYTTVSSTTQSGVEVTTTILDNNGSSIFSIPQGTVKPSEITLSSPISATIKVTIIGTSGANVDLSQITIVINQYIQVYDYFTFEANSDSQSVTLKQFNEGLADSTNIVIPNTVSLVDGVWMDGNDYTVTSIGTDAFYNCSGLTSITLPSSLTSIGSAAFENCYALAEVYNYSENFNITLGNNSYNTNGHLGQYAKVVYNASDLSGEKPASRIQKIGNVQYYVYEEDFIALAPAVAKDLLTTLALDSRTTEINTNAFSFCTYLTSVNLRNCTSLKAIGASTFNGCHGLTSVTLPSSLVSIGGSAFNFCSGLKGDLDLSNCINLVIIGAQAFIYCANLTSITFPNTTGWYTTQDENAISGEPMDMSNPEQNAKWLTTYDSGDDYYNCYFKRNV